MDFLAEARFERDSAFVFGLDNQAYATANKVLELVLNPPDSDGIRTREEVILSAALVIVLGAHRNAIDASAMAHSIKFPDVAAAHIAWSKSRVASLASSLAKEVSTRDKPVRLRTARALRSEQAFLDLLETRTQPTNQGESE